MQLVPVLAVQEQLGNDSRLHHLGSSPLARDHGVVVEVPPEVVGQHLRASVGFPFALHLKGLMVEHEYPARAFAIRSAKGVHIDRIWTAVDGVRAAVPGLLLEILSLDDFCDLWVPRIVLGINDEDVGRSQSTKQQVSALDVRVRHVRAQRCAAGVPAEVVQLVPRCWHFHPADYLLIGGG